MGFPATGLGNDCDIMTDEMTKAFFGPPEWLHMGPDGVHIKMERATQKMETICHSDMVEELKQCQSFFFPLFLSCLPRPAGVHHARETFLS